MNNLNNTAFGILTQVAVGHTTLADVAGQLGVKLQSVTGNLAALKKKELVTYEAGVLALTPAGLAELTPEPAAAPAVVAPVPGTSAKKKDQAAVIIERMAGVRRKDVVAAIMTELDVTANNAGAYIQNYRAAHNLVTPRTKA